MSFENAILVHAAALEKLAAALQAAFGGNVALLATPVSLDGELFSDKAAELATTTEKRAATARASTAKDTKENAVKPDADLDAAVAEVVENSKQAGKEVARVAKAKKDAEAAVSAASSQTNGADSSDDTDGLDTELDYIKDVRPVLLAAIKKAGKDKVQALISTYGVDKADKIEEAKWGDLLGKARALALAD